MSLDGVLAEGRSIRLRRIQASDLEPASAFKYTLSITEPLTDLGRSKAAFAETGFWGQDAGAAAIVAAADERLLGTCQFYRSSPCIHGYEIGYVLHDEADRGKGYASQALRLLTALLFDQRPACHRIQLLIDVDNTPSWRLAEACGYTREGVLRSAGFDLDAPEDCFVYARLRKDLG